VGKIFFLAQKIQKKLGKIAKNGKKNLACLVSKILNDNCGKIACLGSKNPKKIPKNGKKNLECLVSRTIE
jgi:hypothetical protein